MHRHHWILPLVAFVATSFVSREAWAQASTTTAAASACNYQACAIRIERGWFSERLVRGEAGEEVGSVGLFGAGVEVLLSGSDSAAAHARAYNWNTRRSAVFGGAGILLVAIASANTNHFSNDRVTTVDVVTLAAGVTALFVGAPYAIRARRELSRAIWWYNGALPR